LIPRLFSFCRCGAQLGGDLGSSSQALDGILGFGQADSSMLSQLAAARKVRKIFAHCLDTVHGGGIFAIGNVVQPKVKTTPLVQNVYVVSALFPLFPSSSYLFSLSHVYFVRMFLQLLSWLLVSLFDKFSGLPCHGLSAAATLPCPVHTSLPCLYMEELIDSIIYLHDDAGQIVKCGMAFLSLKKKWSSLQY
jgi:hypothetical protein